MTGTRRPLYSAGFARLTYQPSSRAAPVAELVDALDSKSSSARSAGSIPARGTTLRPCGLRVAQPRKTERAKRVRRSRAKRERRRTLPKPSAKAGRCRGWQSGQGSTARSDFKFQTATASRSRRTFFARVLFCTSHPLNQRARGMPGARCARSLVCEMIKAHKHSHYGHTGITRHSPRNGFNSLYRAPR